MNCPTCGQPLAVIESRLTKAGIRRRRRCPSNHRFATLEVIVDLSKGYPDTITLPKVAKYGFKP